jgi:hypothetical protein
MYPSTSIFVAVGQLAIAILVMFSYPLQVHPCRNSLDKIFYPGNKVTKSAVTDSDDDDLSVIDEHGAEDVSTFKHTLLTVAITVSGFMIAYFVDDLQMGGSVHAVTDSARANLPRDSSLLRWFHRVDDRFIHLAWPALLEVNKERSGNGKVVESVRAESRDIRNAGIRVLVRNPQSVSSLWLTKIPP